MRKVIIGVAGLALASGVIYAGDVYTRQPAAYGPFSCNDSCTLRAPDPDPGTLAYIRSMDDYYLNNLPNYAKIPGDTFQVCNPSYCAVYTRSASLDLFGGSPATPNATPGGGGSSGSDGGSWGTDPYANCRSTTMTACTRVGGEMACETIPILDCG